MMVLLKIKKNDGGIIKLPSILRYPSKVQNIEGNNIPYRSCDHIENITNDLNTVGHWGYADPGAKYKNAIAYYPLLPPKPAVDMILNMVD